MIHKIKMLYDNGNGLSIRAIAKETGISRNTVKKYLRQDELTTSIMLAEPERQKFLDPYRDFIMHSLGKAPGLSAVRIERRLRKSFPDLKVSERSIRRYVSKLKREAIEGQIRRYEPILDMVPGHQCQVDPGELRGVLINGVETTVYFVVFVLSYSRYMHVSVCYQPIDTTTFIRMHDAAFRYFGGRPQEMVYDQTKLVVIKELYRELELNERFSEYATHVGFDVFACEGYDPESKGKVEAGVRYVKENALYGETFNSKAELGAYLADWLDTVANVRIHGTTGKKPLIQYEAEERSVMQPYFTPALVRQDGQPLTRKADKTGLISWKANKYSVPMAYQRQTVAASEEEGQLLIAELIEGREIARHTLCSGKGEIIKNSHHYRDLSVRVEKLEQELVILLDNEQAGELFALLKATSPRIYKDQLVGVKKIVKRLGAPTAEQLQQICDRPHLTATQLEWLFEAMLAAKVGHDDEPEQAVKTGALNRYQLDQLTGGVH